MIVYIGVALSGCDIGGVAAYDALWELQRQGFGIGMVSACGTPSVTALLFSEGCDEDEGKKYGERFLRTARELDIDMAVAEFSVEAPIGRRGEGVPLVVSSVEVADGGIRAFGAPPGRGGSRLRCYPDYDVYDALSATISPVEGLASYQYDGGQLCDFSVWYGVPVYPLKLAAVEKIVSIAFLPRTPRTPYEALVKAKITASAHLADVHIPIEFEAGLGPKEYRDTAVRAVRERVEAICSKLLFS